MEVNGSDTIRIVGLVLAVLTFLGGIIYKFSSLTTTTGNHTTRIDKQDKKITKLDNDTANALKGAVQKMEGNLDGVIKEDDHTIMCELATKSICRKLEANKRELLLQINQNKDESIKFYKLLFVKVEKEETDHKEFRIMVNEKLEDIAGFMGAITERNKLIDAERAKRRGSDG